MIWLYVLIMTTWNMKKPYLCTIIYIFINNNILTISLFINFLFKLFLSFLFTHISLPYPFPNPNNIKRAGEWRVRLNHIQIGSYSDLLLLRFRPFATTRITILLVSYIFILHSNLIYIQKEPRITT